MIPGLPFYGRNSSGGAIGYNQIVAEEPSYAYQNTYQNYFYNGIPTIKEKTIIAYEKCGGIMYWDDIMDSPNDELSLLMTINKTIDSLKGQTHISSHIKEYENFYDLHFKNSNLSLNVNRDGIYTVTIHNLQGKQQFKKRMFLETGEAVIPLKLATGTWIVTVENLGNLRHSKLVID